MTSRDQHAEHLTGVSNVNYNLLMILTNKLEGVTALEQYKRDAQGDQEVLQCFEAIQEQDRQSIEQLQSLLVARLGK